MEGSEVVSFELEQDMEAEGEIRPRLGNPLGSEVTSRRHEPIPNRRDPRTDPPALDCPETGSPTSLPHTSFAQAVARRPSGGWPPPLSPPRSPPLAPYRSSLIKQTGQGG